MYCVKSILVLWTLLWLAGPAPGQQADFWPDYQAIFARAFTGLDAKRDVSVEMSGPLEVVHSSFGQWSFVFRAGSQGLPAGGGVALAMRHVSGWGTPQSFDAGAPNFVSVSTTGRVTLRLQTPDSFAIFNEHFYEYFPWQHISSVVITEGQLQPGETITLVMGDRSQGSPGFRAPSVARAQTWLLPLVKTESSGRYRAVPSDFSVATLPSRAVALKALIPSSIREGEALRVIVRAEDDQGNVAALYRGEIVPVSADEPSGEPAYRFRGPTGGSPVVGDLDWDGSEPVRVNLRDPATGLQAQSNPARQNAGGPRVLWGDFHAHSVVSDGSGSPRQLYAYARDVAGLDFFALTDHAYQLPGSAWEANESITTEFNDPPRFVTFYGNEWSGMNDVGGDHNVIYARPGLPIFRSNSYYEPKNPFLYSGSDLDAPHIVQLYKRFEKLAADQNTRILAFPSIRGRRANPQWNDPRFSPVIEVVSEAGWFEDLALDFLRRGHRVGFVGSGDDHYGRPGYGIADRPDVGYGDPGSVPSRLRSRMIYPWGRAVVGSPLMAVMAERNDRESLFDAIFARRCYATTGARILLEFRADGHGMGEEFRGSSGGTLFQVNVYAERPVSSMQLKKDGRVIHTWTPESGTLDTGVSYRDEVDVRGHFYYVIVNQVDGHRAISSPIWVD